MLAEPITHLRILTEHGTKLERNRLYRVSGMTAVKAINIWTRLQMDERGREVGRRNWCGINT